MLVAESAEGSVLGHVAVHWLPYLMLAGPEGYVSDLFVTESTRGAGIGTGLLAAVEDMAISRGCSRLMLVNRKTRESYQRGWEEREEFANFVKKCAFLKRQCPALLNQTVEFCFECSDFPCHRLQRLDERYRRNHKMSMIENLREVKEEGTEAFLEDQRAKYRCAKCGDVVSIHNGRCYGCEPAER